MPGVKCKSGRNHYYEKKGDQQVIRCILCNEQIALYQSDSQRQQQYNLSIGQDVQDGIQGLGPHVFEEKIQANQEKESFFPL